MFITIILLLSWTEFYQNRDLLDTVDCFAGAARVAKISRGLVRKAVALDVGYHPNKKVFDFNDSAGYTLLDLFLFIQFSLPWTPIGIPQTPEFSIWFPIWFHRLLSQGLGCWPCWTENSKIFGLLYAFVVRAGWWHHEVQPVDHGYVLWDVYFMAV